MKNILAAATLLLGTVSFASLAAEQVDSPPANQQKVGVITATGHTTLTSLENHLAQKAEMSGAKSFRIISTSGKNKMHGTAVIYN